MPNQKHRCPHCGAIPATWPRQRILEACRTWADLHGKPPTAAGWRASTHTHPSESMVRREFGSWNAMMEQAGFTTRNPWAPRSSVTAAWGRNEIVAAVFKFKYEHGRLPRWRDWPTVTDEYPPAWRVQRVFGSFSGAIVAAGYEPEYTRRSKRQLQAVSAGVTRRDRVAA
jgi:hypothetical protein